MKYQYYPAITNRHFAKGNRWSDRPWAAITAETPEDAWKISQHCNHKGAWDAAEMVEKHTHWNEGPLTSSCVSDVFVEVDTGRVLMVADFGFDEISRKAFEARQIDNSFAVFALEARRNNGEQFRAMEIKFFKIDESLPALK